MNKYLNQLFLRKNKYCETRIESKIEAIILQNELYFVDIIEDENYYQGFTIIKSNLISEPTYMSIIIIKNINYRLDENFQPKLFINAQIIKKHEKSSVSGRENTKYKDVLNFSESNITETLRNFFDIKEKLLSNIFIVQSSNETEYSLVLFKKKLSYFLVKKYEFLDYSLELKDIIYITDYYIDGKNIKLTQISLIEKLSEEKLFILLQEKEEISNNYLWGKIIEKDTKNKIIRMMTNNKELFTFEKYNNDLKLGQYFIFSNYSIDNNIIKLKEYNDNSFYYYSGEELYFSNKLKMNLFSIIRVYFIDFINEKKNYYKEISIDNKNPIKIKSNKLEIIFNHSININNKLMPLEISLIKDELQKESFYVKIVQGLLNNINALVNYADKSSYYFEYLYFYFKEPENMLEQTQTIKCGQNNYTITAFDNFNSNNRIRFNILNIPVQKDCEEYIKNKFSNSHQLKFSNSILICETEYGDKQRNIYGIFDIMEILSYRNVRLIMRNIDYNSYYYIVGGIYDELKNNKIEDENAVEFLNKYENIFTNLNNSLFLYCLSFGKEIKNIEFKVRTGILICYYLKMTLNKKVFRKILILRDIQHVIHKIELIKDQFTNSQILRIFSYLLRAKIEYNMETEILLLSKENEDSAYLLAQKFILEEIDNINEFSKLFQGYLQMDSYILYNYKINTKSYSLSIEPIYILKNHLKSNYEGFLMLEEVNDNILGWNEPLENILVINEKYLFEKSKFKEPSHIQNETDLKNAAFGISIVLRQKNNSKKNLNNKYINSPLYYCEDGIAINIKNNISNLKGGEDGIIIESLITKDQKTFISLAKDFIYGELLDFRLFVQKDFSELMNKINSIKQENSNKGITKNEVQIRIENKNEMGEIQDYEQNDEDKLSRIAKEVVKTRILKLGDVFYTPELIFQMVMFAESNDSIDQLDPIFIKIYQELKKDQNYNYN